MGRPLSCSGGVFREKHEWVCAFAQIRKPTDAYLRI